MSRVTRTPLVLGLGLSVLLFGFTVGLVSSGATTPPPMTVRLHLGTDGTFFSFGSTVQNLTTQSNTCRINSGEPVMHLTSTGSQATPGLVGTRIGVRTAASGNGTPCGQIDGTETLTLTPGTTIAARTFTGLRLDLIMTGNAVVKLTLANATTSRIFQLQTGTSITVPPADNVPPYFVTSGPNDSVESCAAPNSSGPNSGFNDDCEWTVQPGFSFNRITLTTASGGTVSLGGSGDFGNDPSFDTEFFLTDDPPTPQNDSYSVNENSTLSGQNVLSNDTDPDGNPLSALLVTGPTHGTLSLDATGAFTYTPAQNYFGPDSFVYAASDGLLSTNATASINVVHVNQPPVAVNDTATINENASTAINVTANDTDVDGPFPLVATNIQAVTPTGSTAIANNDGTVTFTPPANYTGAASFTYQAQDGAGAVSANTATVSITVVPVICSGQTVSANDGSISGSFTRLTDSNACKPYVISASQSDGSVLFKPTGDSMVNYRGFVNFGPDASVPGALQGTIEYDPNDGFNGHPMPWCINPQFQEPGHLVTSATIPAGDSWCIASAITDAGATGTNATTWQIYGLDDPRTFR